MSIWTLPFTLKKAACSLYSRSGKLLLVIYTVAFWIFQGCLGKYWLDYSLFQIYYAFYILHEIKAYQCFKSVSLKGMYYWCLFILLWHEGEGEIAGLTDTTVPRRLGPKRASKIRRLFNLSKEDDVRQYVVRRPLPEKDGQCPKLWPAVCYV